MKKNYEEHNWTDLNFTVTSDNTIILKDDKRNTLGFITITHDYFERMVYNLGTEDEEVLAEFLHKQIVSSQEVNG